VNMQTDSTTDDILTPHLERDLPVQLTDAECLDRFKVAAKRKGDLAKLAAQAQRSRDEWKDKLAEVEAEIQGLETAASTGKEIRPVECFERFKGGSVETVRYDTSEVAFVRTATPSDRQSRMGGLLDTAEAAIATSDDAPDEDDADADAPAPVAKRRKKAS
jgi:hypothetical protein